MDLPLAVLYEDAHLIAVNKPAGLLTQGRAGGEPTVEDAVRSYLPRNEANGDAPFLGTVHRLDRPVSGVVLWAKTTKAARRLSAQFASRTAKKENWAVASLSPGDETIEAEGLWDDWLTPSTNPTGVVQIVDPATPGARRAVTRFKLDRSRDVGTGLVSLRLEPETGRTHQLRVQAAARGLPIVGDRLYGSPNPFAAGIALHAVRLSFDHPIAKQRCELTAPLPEAWREWAGVLDVTAF